MKLAKYSMGVGDRFGHQAKAQLKAIMKAGEMGVDIAPVWNKSFREHSIIGTSPLDVRKAADAAVQALDYRGEYHVDADHINIKNVDLFMEASDFFTLDVADFTGRPADAASIDAFIARHRNLINAAIAVEGLTEPVRVTEDQARGIAEKFLLAVQEAGKLYRHILEKKGEGNFIAEVSMDETDLPQKPVDMLFILAAMADEKIPLQTIAPKFTGRFNKGVDYVGDLAQFEKEFQGDLAVIRYAVKEFGLPENLKLSVHSGSDKFSIYPIINRAVRKFGCGLHLKTAGTTWLEELIGLAAADGQGLELARKIYRRATERFSELCKPYATVIDIDMKKLPSPDEVDRWSSEQFCSALRHDQSNPQYNMNFRQMLHVAFKVAADLGDEYISSLEKFEEVIAENVVENIYNRHILPVFLNK